MGKILIGVAVGFFAGAVVVEIIRRSDPEWFARMQAKIKEGAQAAKEAFSEGYHSDTKPAEI
jgi:hypothetical protein